MTYTYDDYMAQINSAQEPRYGSRTDQSHGNFGLSQTYNEGDTNRDYVRNNLGVGGNANSWQNMAHGMLNPAGGVKEGIRGYSNYKKHRSAERAQKATFQSHLATAKAQAGTAWLNTRDPTSQTSQEASRRLAKGQPMSDDEMNQRLRQEGQNKQRAGYEKQVDDYFADPARAGWQRGIVQNRLQNDLANVREDYDADLTGTGQQSAGRGLKGGSIDVENRGAVARTRDTRAIQAGADADTTIADFGARDQQSRAQLHGLVNSGDVGSSDALRSALDGIHSATSAEGARYAGQQRQRQIRQFGQQQQSQAWGSGLRSIATSIDQNPGGYAWLGGSQQPTRGGW